VEHADPETKRSSRVYVVSANEGHDDASMPGPARVSEEECAAWLRRADGLTLHGQRPTPSELAAQVARWWLPDEPIVYIGKATKLSGRVRDYYKTPLGAPKKHGGGRWLKTLVGLRLHFVHWALVATAEDARHAEDEMLRVFAETATLPDSYPTPNVVLPFANLQRDRTPGERAEGGPLTLTRDHRIRKPASPAQPPSRFVRGLHLIAASIAGAIASKTFCLGC
jgi:hypothetical protein